MIHAGRPQPPGAGTATSAASGVPMLAGPTRALRSAAPRRSRSSPNRSSNGRRKQRRIFGEGENVAVFGRFTYTSTKLQKTVTSPFAILLKVVGGKVAYMQFMEDTFCTSSSFRAGGSWQFESNPDGGTVVI